MTPLFLSEAMHQRNLSGDIILWSSVSASARTRERGKRHDWSTYVRIMKCIRMIVDYNQKLATYVIIWCTNNSNYIELYLGSCTQTVTYSYMNPMRGLLHSVIRLLSYIYKSLPVNMGKVRYKTHSYMYKYTCHQNSAYYCITGIYCENKYLLITQFCFQNKYLLFMIN